MAYKEFLQDQKIVNKMLNALGIVKSYRLCVEVDNTPDYKLTPYQKDYISEYTFMNEWRIPDEFHIILACKIVDCKIFQFDDIMDISKTFGVPYIDDHCLFLNKVLHIPNAIEQRGFDPDLEEFKLRDVRIRQIDNEHRRIKYEGSFVGDSYCIGSIDWKLCAIIELEGLSYNSGFEFYKSLIAESLLISKDHNKKLGFFLLHAAFESLVNYELSSEDSEGRLIDKVNDLFSRKFSSLAKHDIYSNLIGQLSPFSKLRNIVAHGKEPVTVSDNDFDNALKFVLAMICSYQFKCDTFNDLATILNIQCKVSD